MKALVYHGPGRGLDAAVVAEIAKYRRFISVAGGGFTVSGENHCYNPPSFARRLSDRGNRMWIRFVLVPGLTDAWENVEGIASFVSTLQTVERVEVLPFHKLGEPKYAKLGMNFH
ncbi:hypothetical protein GCM10029964_086190 [Kibdelosporangium lantanae]